MDTVRAVVRGTLLDEPLPDFDQYQALCDVCDISVRRAVDAEARGEL